MEKPKFKLKNDEEAAAVELQSALNFSTDDLAANQEGHLSAMQRGKLQATERRCMGVGIFGLLIIAWSVLNADGRIDVAIGQGNFAWLAIAGVSAFAWYKWKQYFDDISGPEIASLQGRVNLEIAGNKNTSLTLRLQDTKFTVNKNVFLAFKNGDPYRLYYAPRQKKILSAEWLRDV